MFFTNQVWRRFLGAVRVEYKAACMAWPGWSTQLRFAYVCMPKHRHSHSIYGPPQSDEWELVQCDFQLSILHCWIAIFWFLIFRKIVLSQWTAVLTPQNCHSHWIQYLLMDCCTHRDAQPSRRLFRKSLKRIRSLPSPHTRLLAPKPYKTLSCWSCFVKRLINSAYWLLLFFLLVGLIPYARVYHHDYKVCSSDLPIIFFGS